MVDITGIAEDVRREVEAVRMFREGKSIWVITSLLHVGDLKLKRWLTDAGEYVPSVEERRAERRGRLDKAKALMAQGMGQNAAANECHVDSSDLRAYMERGLTRGEGPWCPLCGVRTKHTPVCADCQVEGRTLEHPEGRPRLQEW